LRVQLILGLSVLFLVLLISFGNYGGLDEEKNLRGKLDWLLRGDNEERERQPESKTEAKDKHDVMRTLRKLQTPQVAELLKLDVELLTNDEAMARFYSEVSSPVQGVCRMLKRFGGLWLATLKAYDGDKFVCMDSYMPKECLVYSFGISTMWEFEDIMDTLKCKVHAYDPTVSFPPERGNSISFQKLGVAAKRDEAKKMETLKDLMVGNGDEKSRIFYLKVDIEGYELDALPEWIESGALEKVDQMALELHLRRIHSQKKFQWLLKLLQQLYSMGFRLVSHEVNSAMGKADQGYYSFLEVVFMKDNVWNFLDD